MESTWRPAEYVAGSFTFYNLSYGGHGGKKHRRNTKGLPECGTRIKEPVQFTGRHGNLELCSKCREAMTKYEPTHVCVACGKQLMFDTAIDLAAQHCKWCQQHGTLRSLASEHECSAAR